VLVPVLTSLLPSMWYPSSAAKVRANGNRLGQRDEPHHCPHGQLPVPTHWPVRRRDPTDDRWSSPLGIDLTCTRFVTRGMAGSRVERVGLSAQGTSVLMQFTEGCLDGVAWNGGRVGVGTYAGYELVGLGEVDGEGGDEERT